MYNIHRCLVALLAWAPTSALAGGNAAGGGVRSVNVDFIGLELVLAAGVVLAHRHFSTSTQT